MKPRSNPCAECLESRRLLTAVPLDTSSFTSNSVGSFFPLGDSIITPVWGGQGAVARFSRDGSQLGTSASPFGSTGNVITYLGTLRGRAVVYLDQAVWITGGSTETTKKLYTFGSFGTPSVAAFGNQLVLAHGSKLVVTDGLASNTQTIETRSRGMPWQSIGRLESLGNSFRFVVAAIEYAEYPFDDEYPHLQLWQSDGTLAGTEILEDWYRNPYSELSANLSSNATGSYFIANVDSNVVLAFDNDRKKPLKVIARNLASDLILALGDGVVFFQQDQGSTSLAFADSGGVVAQRGLIGPEQRVESLQKVGERGLFITTSASHDTLWSTDGTRAGTFSLPLVDVQSNQAVSYEVITAGDDIYVLVKPRDRDARLFVTDGTRNGTFAYEPWLIPDQVEVSGSELLVWGSAEGAAENKTYWLSGVRQVVGTVMYDSPGDLPLAALRGVTVWLDLDRDGRADASEPHQVTGVDGFYQFAGIPKDVRVAVDTQSSAITVAGGNVRTATVAGGLAQRLDFVATSDRRPSAVKGTVRIYATEPTYPYGTEFTNKPGMRVYLDLNQNAKYDRDEPAALTNSKGRYSISGIPGDTTAPIRISTGAGYALNGSAQSHRFVPGQNHDAKAISLFPIGTVQGSVYEDANGNGRRDTSERALAGIRVTVSPLRDPTQPVTSDRNGNFTADVYAFASAPRVGFSGPPDASYRLTQSVSAVVEPGQTSQATVGLTRLAAVSLRFLSDDDGKSKTVTGRSTLRAPPVSSAWIDLNLNDVQDSGESATIRANDVSFNNVPPGQRFKIHLEVSQGYYEVDVSRLPTIVSAGQIYSTEVVVSPLQTLTGNVFHENEQNPRLTTGRTPLAGVTVFIDYNENGTRDAEDAGALTDSAGNYTINNVRLGDRSLLAILPRGLRVQPYGLKVKIRSGSPDRQDVNVTSRGRISGLIYVDNNRNGQLDPGEGDYVNNVDWTIDLPELIARDSDHPEGFDWIGINDFTEPSNFFQFERVPAGTHRMTLEYHPGFDPVQIREVTVTVAPGGETTVLIRIPAGWIR